ncbi:prolipoprotein diacylglyceryl transferase [Fusibacter ferrireducens]|uniref:Phosphatidylglycerol--prolipoprotein diacylglyceryl transferase n=1 Tax=Fusibacter ferrireducens TaxID=2785058 RepID=A0ABR9ZMQ1_9FIRM|nr:prolipoprotein diacylglyceryl transferase [Fusibacter ferrireducens]MBF4691596.1 prolipoprotein diacylglyceryl transferase [Fusibacter ferrireducens]
MNRYAFEIFGVGIAWYGIIIASAMFIGTIILTKIGKRYGYAENDLIDLALVVLPSAIIGARAYYVIFEWSYYSAHPNMILAFRQGGLAIHGGIIGGLIGGYIVCKVKKLNFAELADMIAIPLILGQAIGRWGNYINQEAHGGPTDLPWGIMVDGVKVHPTFLYESIWNLLIFGILLFTFKNRKFQGEHFLKYMIFYSIGRFFIEGLRTDSLMLGPLRIAQVISLVFIVLGLAVIFYARHTGKWKIDENH